MRLHSETLICFTSILVAREQASIYTVFFCEVFKMMEGQIKIKDRNLLLVITMFSLSYFQGGKLFYLPSIHS